MATGKTFCDSKDCPEMVMLPAGSYTNGTPEGEPDRTLAERQLKTIQLIKFAIGK